SPFVAPPPMILQRCDRLEVVRIHAALVPAQVVDRKPIRNRFNRDLPSDPMNESGPMSSAGSNLSVAPRVERSLPVPTPIRTFEVNLLHEPFIQRSSSIVSVNEPARLPLTSCFAIDASVPPASTGTLHRPETEKCGVSI